MALRTVRLDEQDETLLKEIQQATGLRVSEAIRTALRWMGKGVLKNAPRSSYEVYRQLDLGSGGTSLAPAAESSRAVKDIIRKKHRR